MNPQGVPVFYGALDVNTCLAEMRSSLGSMLVIGKFETTAPLRIVDFRLLERAWGGKSLSYFQSDFSAQVERREFLRKVHRLISQPIVPGHEDEYLITQVLAEYLAHVRTLHFDGLLFGSTQRTGGTNVVLFPKRYSNDDVLTRFSVAFAKGSATPYRTKGIQYTHEELRFYEANGEVRVYGEHEDD